MINIKFSKQFFESRSPVNTWKYVLIGKIFYLSATCTWDLILSPGTNAVIQLNSYFYLGLLMNTSIILMSIFHWILFSYYSNKLWNYVGLDKNNNYSMIGLKFYDFIIALSVLVDFICTIIPALFIGIGIIVLVWYTGAQILSTSICYIFMWQVYPLIRIPHSDKKSLEYRINSVEKAKKFYFRLTITITGIVVTCMSIYWGLMAKGSIISPEAYKDLVNSGYYMPPLKISITAAKFVFGYIFIIYSIFTGAYISLLKLSSILYKFGIRKPKSLP